jgi:predicted amidohydrolase
MIKLATVCMNVSFNKQENLKKFMAYIDEAADQGAKLILFPEQALQGYLKRLGLELSIFDYHHENAELVPEGESTQKLIEKAKEKDIYIAWGMTERDEERADVLYNTNVLVGPEGYVGKYRKVHQPLTEKFVYFPGHEFSVFDTKLGKIGMLICYDKAFPESTRELAVQGAEIILMSSAWPLTDGPDVAPENDSHYHLYNMYDMVRAAENQVYYISSNQVGSSGDNSYCGYSRIINPSGKVLAEVGGFKEGLAIAEADIKADIIKGRTYAMVGLNTLKDRRPDAYPHLGERTKYNY